MKNGVRGEIGGVYDGGPKVSTNNHDTTLFIGMFGVETCEDTIGMADIWIKIGPRGSISGGL